MENEQTLMKKAHALQKELSNELLKLEKTQQQQAENEALLKELNNQVVEVKKEIENINGRCDDLQSEINKLEVEKGELQLEIQMNEKDRKDKLVPEIKRYQDLIAHMHESIAQNEVSINKESEK